MGPRKAAKPKAGQQQQQHPAAPAAAAAAAMAQPVQQAPAAAVAAAAAAPAAQAAPEVSLSTLSQLEDRKKRLCHQLKDVERQIFDLETRYLEGCNPNANALTGYEGLRNATSVAKPSKAAAVVDEDRIFSGSSTSTTAR